VAAAGSALHIALTQNGELAERLDSASDVIEKMAAVGVYQTGDWRLLRRATVNYPGGRVTYDCLAIKIAKDNSRGGK